MTSPDNYTALLELPLFLGMSKNDLASVITLIKPRISVIAKGNTFIKENDVCDSLYFLMSGKVNAISNSDDNGYTLAEVINATAIFQPERIFGLKQRYTKTFQTVTECKLIKISKADVMKLSDEYEIFRLNLLNIICALSQRNTRYQWRKREKSIRGKIVRFIETRSIRPAGEKKLTIKLETLGLEIGESRLNTSRELHKMHDSGLIIMKRNEIIIPAFEKLLMK